MRVNLVAEIDVVDFICISFVHVASQDEVKNGFRCKDSKLG